MERDPPLNAIRAFEAAGRLASISAAAQELHVTPAAVSHQVKALETFVKMPLFKRGHRTITLTQAGAQYLEEVSRHLAGIRKSTAAIIETRGRRTLRIQAHATIAMRWLIPRLSSFHATHPEIAVNLTTSLQTLSFDDAQFDCAIKLGHGEWRGSEAHRLVRNELTPVCRPELARRRAHLVSPRGLAKETLLHSLARPDDWAHWLEALHVTTVDPYGGLKYDSSVLAYQAAIEGQGIAIAQRALVDSDVTAGRLTYLYARKVLDMGSFTYYLICPRDRTRSPELDTFRDWLLGESLESGDRPTPTPNASPMSSTQRKR